MAPIVRRKAFWAVVTVVAAGLASWLALRSKPLDSRFNGAYRFDDGRLVAVSASDGAVLRYRTLDGETAQLYPVGGRAYDVGTAFAERAPVTGRVRFEAARQGPPPALTWTDASGREERAQRLPLRERDVHLRSGAATLRAKLVLPPGPGPHPAVVLVHGSENTSAVDGYEHPWLLAPSGIAALVFDKRGTGGSDGEFTAYFPTLARDVVAALAWLRTVPEIDPERLHLAGFSQGGWVAPLAATMDGHVRSVLVGYGTTLPVRDAERWKYACALERRGLGGDALAEVAAVDELVLDILQRREDRWRELAQRLREAEGRPWLEVVGRTESILGFVTSKPLLAVRLYVWWLRRRPEPFIDLLYDPLPTLRRLDSPSIWLLAERDSSAPTAATVEQLRGLAATGRSISIRVFRETEHGIKRFVETPEGRRISGYDPEYYPAIVSWLRDQSGLE